MLYHNYDYFREQRVNEMPAWMKAERYQYCEHYEYRNKYPDTVNRGSLISKIKNFFKRKRKA